jgi:hypothetical protein
MINSSRILLLPFEHLPLLFEVPSRTAHGDFCVMLRGPIKVVAVEAWFELPH